MGKWMAWAAGLVALGGVAIAAWVIPFSVSTTPNDDPPRAGSATIYPGWTIDAENAEGEGVRITFVEVIEDSRCPKNVVCVQAGQVVIALKVEGGSLTAAEEVRLALESAPDGESVEVAGMRIQLTDVQPYPEDAHTTQPGDYTATLKFEAIED